METVLRIIEKRLECNEILNKNDVLFIINEYARLYDLGAFIKKVYFSNRDFQYTAIYNHDDFSLSFMINRIYECAVTNYKDVSKNNNVSFNSFYNFYFLMSLFHEIKHVIQYKKMFLGIEDNFLKVYEFDDNIRERKGYNQRLYYTHHDLFPCEREANIFSISETLKYFSMLKSGLVSKEELRYYQLYYINMLLSNYDKKIIAVKSPFEKLLRLGNYDVTVQLESIGEIYLSLYNRLQLGLPISKKEYERILDLGYLIEDDKISPSANVEKIIIKRG